MLEWLISKKLASTVSTAVLVMLSNVVDTCGVGLAHRQRMIM